MDSTHALRQGHFVGKVVLITGAGRGLGRELARQLAPEGATIAALDLSPEPLAELAAELAGQSVAWAVCDVTDRAALQQAVVQMTRQLGPIDLLIANAGIGRPTSALQFDAADLEEHIRVNLIGVANSVEAVLPAMIERRQGHLVVISSLASYRGLPRMLGYCASKAGVRALFDGLRVELKPLGITVTTICPSWIRTPMTKELAKALPRMMELPEAARRIVQAIRRGRAFAAFPASDVWFMRLLAWLPCGLSDWLTARVFRRGAKRL